MPTSTGPAPARTPWTWAGLGFLVIAGILAVAQGGGGGGGGGTTTTSASTTTAATTTTSSTPATTTTAPGLSYVRPFGDSATWNRPVAELGTHARSADFSHRCYLYCSTDGPGKIATYFDDYSQPVYDIRTATTTIKVYRTNFGVVGSIANGASIPWNPSWRPGGGNDAIMILLNPDTGREIDLWTTYLPGDSRQTTCITADNFAAGLNLAIPNLCAGQADIVQDAAGNPIDYRTYTGTYPEGGAYFQLYAMTVTAAEVEAGAIRHALQGVAYNTMFGPQCSDADYATSAWGDTCGHWINPASRLEWVTQTQDCGIHTIPYTNAQRQRTVPEGARFYITATDKQINTWLDSRGYTGELRRTARIFAVALREYGWIITNTSCAQAGIITTGRFGPDAGLWNALGVPTNTNTAMNLLDGLVTDSNLRMAGASAAMSVGSQAVHP